MNNLTWFLYFADVLGNINAGLVALLTMVGIVLCVVGGGFACVEDWKTVLRLRPYAIGWFVVYAMLAFIPSKDTVYAMAASEFGEQLMETKVATKATKALELWLDQKINEHEGADK